MPILSNKGTNFYNILFMYQYPHTIENKFGEKIIFLELIKEADGDKLV